MNFAGIRIVQTKNALDVRVVFKVARHSARCKKRKNWRVLREVITRPGCFESGGVLYMHPELFAQLPR